MTPALASRIGSQIHLAVAQAFTTGRISSGADLVGQQAFRNILSQHLASTSSSYTDQQARQSLLDFMRRNANRTGADFANFVAQFRRGGGYADRASDRDGGALLTSARFDGFSGADAAFLNAMRRYAIDRGLHWAADRPEILRLGHEGIDLLARTGFTRDSHDRLHAAGFNHHDMVHIARYAERHGLDVNHVSSETAAAVNSFGAGSSEARQSWINRFRRFYENPNDEETRRDMTRALDEMERDGTPEQSEHARRMRDITRRVGQALEADSTATDAARAEAAAREARERAEAAERAREAEERAAREAEAARAEAERARLAALMAGENPPTDGPAPVPAVQEGPAPGAGQQRAEARSPNRPTVALTT